MSSDDSAIRIGAPERHAGSRTRLRRRLSVFVGLTALAGSTIVSGGCRGEAEGADRLGEWVPSASGTRALGLTSDAAAGSSTRQSEEQATSARAGAVDFGDRLAGVTARRMWAGGYRDFYASSISPDGRYMSMIDWRTTDLAVLDLQTGTQHRLTHIQRSGDDDEPYEDVGVSVFSRDGRRLVIGWQHYPDLQLRLFDFDIDEAGVPQPGEASLLFYNPEYYPYYPFDWSPDGDRILAKVYVAGNANQLALISTADGSYRSLRSFDWREPLMAEFSPDGQYVAYDFPADTNSPDRDIIVLSVDGLYEAVIVDGPGVNRLLGWHPDGGIIFHSDRGGTRGIWRVPVVHGRVTAPAELLRADVWNAEPLGIAGDRLYYGSIVDPVRLRAAMFDPETGRSVGEPVLIGDPATVQIGGWDWSPDGEYLAYSGRTPGAQGSVIGIVDASGREVRRIRVELGSTSRIRWHPDQRSIFVYARDSKARRGFHRIDLESGRLTALLVTDQMDEPTPRGNFVLSPDGETLYYARGNPRQSPDRLRMIALDLSSGSERHIIDVSAFGFGAVGLSPDGSRLAAVSPDGAIATVPVTGGRFHELFPIDDDKLVMGLEWTPDGKSIAVTSVRPAGDASYRIELVPADGGEPRRLELGDRIDALVRFHPDGRRIAYMSGDSRGEVWVVEGIGGVATAATGVRRPR